MNNKYMYLFPFEKVKFASKILIYGAGDVGQEYLQQMLITHYATVIGFLDRAYERFPSMRVPIYAPVEVKNLIYDYVVIALKTGFHLREVKDTLVKLGVAKEKIIFVSSREEIQIIPDQMAQGVTKTGKEYAFYKNGISVALKLGPGLGDCIVKKKIFLELVRMCPLCNIDIYAPNATKVVPSIYVGHKNLNLIIDDGGALYVQNIRKYHIALKLFFLLEIDNFQYDRVHLLDVSFANKIQALKEYCGRYHLSAFPTTNLYIHFQRMKYYRLNYYNYLNATGVFNIRDSHVDIPMEKAFLYQYKNMHLVKYITLNYGTGAVSAQNGEIIAKQWPFQYFCVFVELFHRQYPGIEVIQLGTKDMRKVLGADQYVLGEDLGLVKYILKGSILHVDSEGGLVHLATQLGTKCAVVFGPTPVEFFGYAENINIVSKKCTGCHCLYDEFDVCARGMAEKECMWSITPEMVMERIRRVI